MSAEGSESLKRILPMMRRAAARELDGQTQTGTPLEGIGKGGVTCWWHKAPTAQPAPVLFELHGGGFALGDVRKGDALRTWMAHRYGAHVVGVGYRLAPEHPWPAALEDATDAVRYFADHAEELGMDPSRFYFIGYSAGANLALATCFALQKEPAPAQIKGCALHYPFVDAATDPATLPLRTEDLPVEMMSAFNDWYAGDNDVKNPLISPLYATDEQLAQLPFVTQYPAVGDALFDSACQLDERMRDAGARCAFHPVEGVYHGYIEDAENVEVYRATSLPETLAARPANFAQVAAESLAASLDEILGRVANDVPFDAESARQDAERFAAETNAHDAVRQSNQNQEV